MSRKNGTPGSEEKNGNKEDVKLLNVYLDGLQAKIYDAHQTLLNAEKEVTTSAIKDILNGVNERKWMICEVFEDHNSEMYALIGNGFTKGTYNRYDAALRNVRLFLKYKLRKVRDIFIFCCYTAL